MNSVFRVGAMLGARYIVEEQIGSGGMAEVYRARDIRLARRVALKTIRLDRLADRHRATELRQRLLREAHAAANLQHPGIVVVHDVGDENGVPYLSMELIGGGTLRDLIREQGGLHHGRAIPLLVQILEALGYAHRRGVIHRDVKPENVMFTTEGRVKLADFGIARFSTPGSAPITREGGPPCTFNYTAPEVLEGAVANERSDLFSFGCVMYETLTGSMAFQSDTEPGVLMKILRETPRRPANIKPDLPPELDAITMRLLRKRPEDRYGSCQEVLDDLRRFSVAETWFGPDGPVPGLAGEPGLPDGLGLEAPPDAPPPPRVATAPDGPTARRPGRAPPAWPAAGMPSGPPAMGPAASGRRRWLTAGGLILALALAAGGIWSLAPGRGAGRADGRSNPAAGLSSASPAPPQPWTTPPVEFPRPSPTLAGPPEPAPPERRPDPTASRSPPSRPTARLSRPRPAATVAQSTPTASADWSAPEPTTTGRPATAGPTRPPREPDAAVAPSPRPTVRTTMPEAPAAVPAFAPEPASIPPPAFRHQPPAELVEGRRTEVVLDLDTDPAGPADWSVWLVIEPAGDAPAREIACKPRGTGRFSADLPRPASGQAELRYSFRGADRAGRSFRTGPYSAPVRKVYLPF